MAEITTVSSRFFGLTPANAKKKEMDMQSFIELLSVQLANQNPLEPMNDRDFFAQMAQLGTVQGIDKMQQSMQITQASSLIGRNVTAVRPMTESTTSTNDLVTGRVVGLTVKNGENILQLRQENGGIVDVKMTAIRQVQE